ncbi:hypothetical protein FIBSPDRAFT_751003, partial [Athelia psychrophila]
MNAAHKTLHSLLKDIGDVDEELSQMRVAFQRLQEKRQALQDYAEAHRGFVSPLRRLPAEILSQIFIQALPAHSNMSPHDAPLLLERVCKRWKDITRSTPTLW